jgi:hypothetical protein
MGHEIIFISLDEPSICFLCKWMGHETHIACLHSRGGFIGGCTGVLTPVGLRQQGSNGGANKLNSEIWHNFQGFSFFEVKLKLIIQRPYRRKWHF